LGAIFDILYDDAGTNLIKALVELGFPETNIVTD